MRTYELMAIHRPELAEEDVRSKIADVEKFLGDSGAKVTNTDHWGKRRFAYEIEHTTEGFYTVVNFESETDVVAELDRTLGLSDDVIRHKVFRPGA